MGPPSPRQQFGPRHSVVFLLSKLGSLAGRSFAACLEPLGLEPRQFAVLNFIALDEGRSQQALGDALEIPASRMVAIVDDLESRAIVERRTNPADRRARALYLTARGKAVDSGTEGDTVTVLNLQSKRTISGTVVGRDQVAIAIAMPRLPPADTTSSIGAAETEAPVSVASRNSAQTTSKAE